MFAPLGEREARPYLADLFLFRIVAGWPGRGPAAAARPADGEVTAGTGLRPTAAGRHARRGEAGQVALNGIDRWIGGVHLHGEVARWRWDEGTESIVSAGNFTLPG